MLFSCQLNQWQARKPVKTNWSCRALAIYKLRTPFTALVQKPETRKMNEFLKETIFFFIFCFSFLLFVFKFRATGVLCFSNNQKYKSDRMLNFSLVRSAFARKASCCCLVPRRLSSMCAQRKAGRRQRARTSVPFPWSLAVHHQSLAFRVT